MDLRVESSRDLRKRSQHYNTYLLVTSLGYRLIVQGLRTEMQGIITPCEDTVIIQNASSTLLHDSKARDAGFMLRSPILPSRLTLRCDNPEHACPAAIRAAASIRSSSYT